MTALKALMAVGFTVVDVCVCGTTDTLSMAGSALQNSASINPALVALFIRTEPYQATKDSQTIVCSRGSLFSTLNALISQRRQNDSNTACDDSREISSDFIAHIEQGQLVLVVDVDEPQRLIRASQILLKFSPHVIQTREFLLA